MLGTITFVVLMLLYIALSLRGGRPNPNGFIWWVKLFVLLMALVISSAFLWLLSLPLYIGLRRLPPLPVIRIIHGALTEVMKWVFPIGLAVAVVLFIVHRIFRPIILGVTLGIVDISKYTPFQELIQTGIFTFVGHLLVFNIPGMFSSGLEIVRRTPEYARDLFSSEILTIKEATSNTEAAAKETIDEREQAVQRCINANTIPITDLMTEIEKRTAQAENEKTKRECQVSPT